MKFQEKIFIIAEIGVNHNGNYTLAKKLIDAAKKAGADAVKFQTYLTEEFVTNKTGKVNYQKKNSPKKETHFQMLKKLELKQNEFKSLRKYCKKKKIYFISTPYDLKSVDFLKKIETDIFKVASADINDFLLHKKLSSINKQIIISTGMSSLKDIEKIIPLYKKKNLILLHCVSRYPCPDQEVNLAVINSLKNKFKIPIGFSDHCKSYYPAMMAVSMGVKIFEKHLTLSNKMKGPDHEASLNPINFAKYVAQIKMAKNILGSPIKKIYREEKEMKRISSKSVTLKIDLKKNQKLSLINITMKRPGTGLSGFEIKNIIGKKIKYNKPKNYQIKFGDLY
jgi:sialic acid synthase SpsE